LKSNSINITVHKIDTPYLVGPVDIFELWSQGKHILIDTGPPTQTATDYLNKHIDLSTLDYLLVTHCHPDHYGLAQYILDHSPAKLILAHVDGLLAELFPQRIEFLTQTFSSLGIPEDFLGPFKQLLPKFQGDIPFPRHYQRLEDSEQLLSDLGIHWMACPGHSQSDIIFTFEGQAVTGDVLLRNIFSAPLLDMDLTRGEGRFSNYNAYCESLRKLHGLRNTQVRPSHNDWILGVDEQILFYCHKIIQRSQKIEPLFGERGTIYEILERLFPDLIKTPFKFYVKTGELYFLLDYLNEPERLHQSLEHLGLREALGV